MSFFISLFAANREFSVVYVHVFNVTFEYFTVDNLCVHKHDYVIKKQKYTHTHTHTQKKRLAFYWPKTNFHRLLCVSFLGFLVFFFVLFGFNASRGQFKHTKLKTFKVLTDIVVLKTNKLIAKMKNVLLYFENT